MKNVWSWNRTSDLQITRFASDSNSSTDALPTRLSRPLTNSSPRHLLNCFISTGRMSPNLHVEVLHSQHMHGACTTSVHIHAFQRRIIISHKDFKFIRVDVSVPEIYV